MCTQYSIIIWYCSEQPYTWFAVSSGMYAMAGRLGSTHQKSQWRQEVIFVTFYIGWSESDIEINHGHFSVAADHWFQVRPDVQIQPRSIRGKLHKYTLKRMAKLNNDEFDILIVFPTY